MLPKHIILVLVIFVFTASSGISTNDLKDVLAYTKSSRINESLARKNRPEVAGYTFSSGDDVIFTIAGNGDIAAVDGVGTLSASFKYPFGIASDYFNAYLYVSDKYGQSIRQINRITSQVITINIEQGEINKFIMY